MKTLFARFLKDESGATAIEYGLIAAVMCIGLAAAIQPVRDALNTTFTNLSMALGG